MNYVDEGLYFEGANLANELALEVSNYCNVPLHRITSFYIRKYMEEVEEVEFLEVEFGKHLSKYILGSIAKVEGEVLISLNKQVIRQRLNFSSMHEVAHFYHDLSNLENGQSLSDRINEDDYPPEEWAIEYRANATASVLMANDTALKYAIEYFGKFDKVADYFSMSKAALQVRLIEHLSYVQNCAPDYARSLVNNFRYSNGNNFFDVFYL